MKTQTEPVERLIATVRARRAAAGARPLPKSGWKAVAGTVKDDAFFREAGRLGDEWRMAENKRR
ncbi:MAG: hypothetical protein K1X78_16820 [Verrucomicrobiaceae bacterium]|nr:hypothetical protein [Verrucomicrobiaceae bacterium]